VWATTDKHVLLSLVLMGFIFMACTGNKFGNPCYSENIANNLQSQVFYWLFMSPKLENWS